MNNRWVLSQEQFDALLEWLDPDREAAALRYEEIRQRLIRIFISRRCSEPEDLADETINRVAGRVQEVQNEFHGPQASYFFGVARNIHHEYLRRKHVSPSAPHPVSPTPEQAFECLEYCLDQLSEDNRDLVKEYYKYEGQEKIEHRKRLAQSKGIPLNALRIRAFRVRRALYECIKNCLGDESG